MANKMTKAGLQLYFATSSSPNPKGFVSLQANNKRAAASPGFTLTEEGCLSGRRGAAARAASAAAEADYTGTDYKFAEGMLAVSLLQPEQN